MGTCIECDNWQLGTPVLILECELLCFCSSFLLICTLQEGANDRSTTRSLVPTWERWVGLFILVQSPGCHRHLGSEPACWRSWSPFFFQYNDNTEKQANPAMASHLAQVRAKMLTMVWKVLHDLPSGFTTNSSPLHLFYFFFPTCSIPCSHTSLSLDQKCQSHPLLALPRGWDWCCGAVSGATTYKASIWCQDANLCPRSSICSLLMHLERK